MKLNPALSLFCLIFEINRKTVTCTHKTDNDRHTTVCIKTKPTLVTGTGTYIHHKSHKCGWCWHTHDSPEGGRSFLGTLFCRPVTSRSSPVTACPCPHSPPGRDNWTLGEILHTQIVAVNLCTGHECHLKSKSFWWVVWLHSLQLWNSLFNKTQTII